MNTFRQESDSERYPALLISKIKVLIIIMVGKERLAEGNEEPPVLILLHIYSIHVMAFQL